MRASRIVFLSFLLGLVLLSGCVVLDGQRISWFYDEAKDELQILLDYDGVHDSGSNKHGKADEQLRKFVENGEVMFLDWPWHFSPADLRTEAQKKDASEFDKKMARLLAIPKVEVIGFYREPSGRMGATQRIVIPHAKDFIKKVNEAINTGILEDHAKKEKPKDKPEPSMSQTEKRMLAAAAADHQWVRLDGQTLHVVLPVHPGEWNRHKAAIFTGIVERLRGKLENKGDSKEAVRFLHMFAFTPVSYIDRGDEVELIIGRPKSTSTFRTTIRDDYKPTLESLLVELVKTDLDRELAKALLNEESEPSEMVAALLKFGPPEDQVRALITTFESSDGERKAVIVERLNTWAAEWNRDQIFPHAPTGLKPDDDLSAWKNWYATVKWPEVEPPKKKEAKTPADKSGKNEDKSSKSDQSVGR